MSERKTESSSGAGCGCVSLPVVILVGGVLSFFEAAVSGGCTVRIPMTDANVSVAGAVGHKSAVMESLPPFLSSKVGDNRNFINGSQTFTIGPAEGVSVGVWGHQDGAPVFNIGLRFARKPH